jgi:AcrR family transcriptional regulator
LIEGTLRCLELLPLEQVTARAIAAESGANLASITYHFGSKDNLVTAAVVEGLDRWLIAVAQSLDDMPPGPPGERLLRAGAVVEASRDRHRGLAKNFVTALAKAQHDYEVRQLLADGFRHARSNVAAVVQLGDDEVGSDAGALVLAMFHGLLLATMLDPDLGVDGDRLSQALARLRTVLPGRTP